MCSEWDLDAIARLFSDAAVGFGAWQDSLDAISEKLGALGATIVPLKGELASIPVSSGFAEAIDQYFKDGWHKQDVRFHGLAAMRRKGCGTDLDFISEQEIRRSPYYQEWLRPHGLKWFVGVHIAGLEEEWVLSLQRSEGQGPFSTEECESLVKLSRSLSSSAALANALAFSRADAVLEAFTISGKAVVILNRLGEVVRTNGAAGQMLDGSLQIRGRRLTCSDRASTMRLDRAVQMACSTPQDCFNAPVLLRRPDDGPIVAFVSPARGIAKDILSPCHAYVILTDPLHRDAPSPAVMQTVFGLTRSEAVLACRLGRGDRLRDIAIFMGISYETGRTHLRNIFAKTGVNNQADLTALLLQVNMPFSS